MLKIACQSLDRQQGRQILEELVQRLGAVLPIKFPEALSLR